MSKERTGLILAILTVVLVITSISLSAKINSLQKQNNALESELLNTQDQLLQLSKDQKRLSEAVLYWLEAWQVDMFEASAYSPLDDQNGLNSWDDGSVMASGAKTIDNIDIAIAVDPTVIPLGSRVWIQGVGWRTALDTGGAIKGKKIDICMWSFEDAVQYAKKDVFVVYPKEGRL